jgi:hypothetical protein
MRKNTIIFKQRRHEKDFCINTELTTYRLNKQTTRIIIMIIRIIPTTGTTITTAVGRPPDLDIPVINT